MLPPDFNILSDARQCGNGCRQPPLDEESKLKLQPINSDALILAGYEINLYTLLAANLLPARGANRYLGYLGTIQLISVDIVYE